MLKHVRDIIKMPTEEEAEIISSKFEKICSIPQILLLIDGTHIPILAPEEGHGDFINRKGWTSYNVQIVADVDYMYKIVYKIIAILLDTTCVLSFTRIRDVSCKYPGASHDALVLKNSGFFQHISNLLPKVSILKRINMSTVLLSALIMLCLSFFRKLE